MIYTTIDVCRQLSIKVFVSPYEADAQLAYLVNNGLADLAITEDSDLVCYGCQTIVFKLNQDGNCEVLENLAIRSDKQTLKQLQSSQLKSFFSFADEQTIDACIMAGCDYLPSIKGIGIKKSVDYLSRFQDSASAIRHMRTEMKLMGKIPLDYEQSVQTIRNIFLYQRVYDPNTKKLVTFRTAPMNFRFKKLIGEPFENAEKFCAGLLHFKSMKEREVVPIDFAQIFQKKKKIAKLFTENKKLASMSDQERKYHQQEIQKIRDRMELQQDIALLEDMREDELDLSIKLFEQELMKEEMQLSKTFEQQEEPDYEKRMQYVDQAEQVDYLFDICAEIAKENQLEDEDLTAGDAADAPDAGRRQKQLLQIGQLHERKRSLQIIENLVCNDGKSKEGTAAEDAASFNVFAKKSEAKKPCTDSLDMIENDSAAKSRSASKPPTPLKSLPNKQKQIAEYTEQPSAVTTSAKKKLPADECVSGPRGLCDKACETTGTEHHRTLDSKKKVKFDDTVLPSSSKLESKKKEVDASTRESDSGQPKLNKPSAQKNDLYNYFKKV